MKKAINQKPAEKPYWEMNLDELREATKEFDRKFVPTEPLTREMRARWERVKRKRGRPVRGDGAKVISLSVARGLRAVLAVYSHA